MKTLRVSDEVHAKLTGVLGKLTAQTGNMHTYQDAISAMLNQSVILPQDLLVQVEAFIQKTSSLASSQKRIF